MKGKKERTREQLTPLLILKTSAQGRHAVTTIAITTAVTTTIATATTTAVAVTTVAAAVSAVTVTAVASAGKKRQYARDHQKTRKNEDVHTFHHRCNRHGHHCCHRSGREKSNRRRRKKT